MTAAERSDRLADTVDYSQRRRDHRRHRHGRAAPPARVAGAPDGRGVRGALPGGQARAPRAPQAQSADLRPATRRYSAGAAERRVTRPRAPSSDPRAAVTVRGTCCVRRRRRRPGHRRHDGNGRSNRRGRRDRRGGAMGVAGAGGLGAAGDAAWHIRRRGCGTATGGPGGGGSTATTPRRAHQRRGASDVAATEASIPTRRPPRAARPPGAICWDFEEGAAARRAGRRTATSTHGLAVVDNTRPHRGKYSLHAKDFTGGNEGAEAGRSTTMRFNLPAGFGPMLWGRAFVPRRPARRCRTRACSTRATRAPAP